MRSRRASRQAVVLPQTVIGPRRATLVVAATLLVAGMLAYANSLSNPFLSDDHVAITTNTTIRDIRQVATVLSPPPETPVARRPLVNLSFAMNYAAGGLDVRGYHLGNLAIHLLAAFTLFALVRRALLLEALAPRFEAHATGVAAAASLLWMLHPLHTEVINFASQRTTALTGLLALVALYGSLRALSGSPRVWYAVATAASAGAMASKESAVTIPLLIVLFDRTFVFASFGEAYRQRRRLYLGLAATWLVLLWLMASGGRTTVGFSSGVGPWTYLLNQAPILLDYLRLSAWPVGLVVDYGLPRPLGFADVLGSFAAISLLAVAALLTLRVAPRAGFLAVSWFIALAPTSSVVPIVTEVGAERRAYLSLAAFVVLVTCAAYRAGARLTTESGRRGPELAGPVLGATLVAVVATWLASGVIVRNREYRTPLSLAQSTVERRPHGRAYHALAVGLLDSGDRAGAMESLRLGAPDFPGARFMMGGLLLEDGHVEDGMRELRAFIELEADHPAVVPARQMIAAALFDRGDYAGALDELEQVIAASPRNGYMLALAGEVLVRMHRPAEALAYLERASAMLPPAARFEDLLGTALAQVGRLPEALRHFRAASAADPGYEPARKNAAAAEAILRGEAPGP